MRSATVQRSSHETQVVVAIDLDGGDVSISTPVPFFSHMLSQLGVHGGLGLSVEATGDWMVDAHHLVEDTGIALGQAFREALGDRLGLERFADRTVPLDESLIRVAIDISGRGMAVVELGGNRSLALGTPAFYVEHAEEFLAAFARHGGCTLHVHSLADGNTHHQLEATFKGFAKTVHDATRVTSDAVVSSKGLLDG
ncbi:imidazoleglycerol-phosphate dehydratase [Ferrimicrobium acidiphilum]|uniref:Imidazoleglycerol-phosphate dehydratase n=1 Tax=Ferrimicrobium acidiphilum DSM 19497 TaxID=1121877 RepID=A0A0D8FRP1_9ACTN|nr:imidazoleglycerol-phosphate dehydratase [Ferrimicrobium acidiphilum]KJE75948.1 imidazoleglycerol-phosphate dehydratase [Ferrimicrobium acidiphilum DSM 19497]